MSATDRRQKSGTQMAHAREKFRIFIFIFYETLFGCFRTIFCCCLLFSQPTAALWVIKSLHFILTHFLISPFILFFLKLFVYHAFFSFLQFCCLFYVDKKATVTVGEYICIFYICVSNYLRMKIIEN